MATSENWNVQVTEAWLREMQTIAKGFPGVEVLRHMNGGVLWTGLTDENREALFDAVDKAGVYAMPKCPSCKSWRISPGPGGRTCRVCGAGWNP